MAAINLVHLTGSVMLALALVHVTAQAEHSFAMVPQAAVPAAPKLMLWNGDATLGPQYAHIEALKKFVASKAAGGGSDGSSGWWGKLTKKIKNAGTKVWSWVKLRFLTPKIQSTVATLSEAKPMEPAEVPVHHAPRLLPNNPKLVSPSEQVEVAFDSQLNNREDMLAEASAPVSSYARSDSMAAFAQVSPPTEQASVSTNSHQGPRFTPGHYYQGSALIASASQPAGQQQQSMQSGHAYGDLLPSDLNVHNPAQPAITKMTPVYLAPPANEPQGALNLIVPSAGNTGEQMKVSSSAPRPSAWQRPRPAPMMASESAAPLPETGDRNKPITLAYNGPSLVTKYLMPSIDTQVATLSHSAPMAQPDVAAPSTHVVTFSGNIPPLPILINQGASPPIKFTDKAKSKLKAKFNKIKAKGKKVVAKVTNFLRASPLGKLLPKRG